MPRRIARLALGLVLVAGCGDDEDPTTVIQTTTVTETSPGTATTPDTTGTTTDPELTTPEQRDGCTDDAGNEIDVLTGDVACSAAQDTAAQYDQQGARVQEIGEWVCEGGNAQTRPVIFTCTGPGGEFVVREPG